MAWQKGWFLLVACFEAFLPLCSSVSLSLSLWHDMLWVHAVNWAEESLQLLGPTKILYWQAAMQMVPWGNEAFIVLLLLPLSLPFPVFCLWLLLWFIRFQQLQKMDRDLEGIIILTVVKTSNWLWETVQNVINFNTRQQRIYRSCRRDEENYTMRIQTARKALIETLIILSATKCNSGQVISMLVKPFVLYSVLYCQMLPVKEK